MARLASIRPGGKPAGRALLAQLIWLALGCGAVAVPDASAKRVRHAEAVEAKPDPDVLLISIYKDLAANHLRDAQTKVDALVQAYPNFHLAHLIRGDLLLMHAQPVVGLGAGSNATINRLKDLRDEAAVRLKSLSARPAPEMVPRAVLQLRDDQKYVLVVDAKQSRLYVYQNQNGQPKFITDYYITQGKLGVNKLKEGDQKTPLGVYTITSRVAQARLPDFYGSGALRINYPNEWDKVNGRGGSGIWLHGTPFDRYSRPPLASDGCVILTNPDLKKLEMSIEIGNTPVIISDQVEFISKVSWIAERNIASNMVDTWRHDIESMDPVRVRKNYSGKFKSSLGEDLNTWLEKNKRSLSGTNPLSIKLREMSLFRYPGRDDIIVGTFLQENSTGKSKSVLRKRQYWAREGAQWKIVYEGNV